MLKNPMIPASSILAIHGSSILGRKNLTLDDELYTRSDILEMFNIDSSKLDSRIRSNDIPYVALGGMYYFFPAKETDLLLSQLKSKIEVTGVPSIDLHRTVKELHKRMSPEAIAAELGIKEFEVYKIIYEMDAGIRFRKHQLQQKKKPESKWFESFSRLRDAQEYIDETKVLQKPRVEQSPLAEKRPVVVEHVPETPKHDTVIPGSYSKLKKERKGRSIVFDSVVDVLAPRLGRPRKSTDETPEAAAERRVVSEIQYLLLKGRNPDEIHVITGESTDTIKAIQDSLEERFGDVLYPLHLDKHKKTILLAVFAGNEFREVAKEYGITSRQLSLFIMSNKPSWPERFVPNTGGISGLGVLAIGTGLLVAWYFLRNQWR